MNLIDVIKSGKPFDGEASEDKGLVLWQDGPTGEAYLAKSGNFGERRRLKVSDLYTNWEIQEPTATITRTQLADAILAYIAAENMASHFFEPAGNTYPDPVSFIARKLGLGD